MPHNWGVTQYCSHQGLCLLTYHSPHPALCVDYEQLGGKRHFTAAPYIQMCNPSAFQLTAISKSPLGSAKYRVQYQPTPPILHLQPCNNEPGIQLHQPGHFPVGQSSTCARTGEAIAYLVWCNGSSLLTALSDRNGASELWNANSCCRLVAHGKKSVNDMSVVCLQNKDC